MRSLRVAAAAAALTLALAACGSSSSASSSTPSQAGGGGGTKIAVTEKDFSISIAGGNSIPTAGKYTFVVTNKGPSSHNLTITGPGVSNAATPTSGPGTENLTVTLKAGKYDFFCSVPGHKSLGMNAEVTVG